MKVFISADMEGLTTTTRWADCDEDNKFYSYHTEQMTQEVVAACQGAIAAGASEIVVKDAHGTATNIDVKSLPKCAKLTRGWSGHPYAMVQGIDESFDAAMFIGYHSPAGRAGNPMSHTMTARAEYMKINGDYAGEFYMYSHAAALEGVPTVFLSGDQALCDFAETLHPGLVTVAVKEGWGSSTTSLAPEKSLELIREGAERALRQDLSKAKISLPESFVVEMRFKEHVYANKMSFYPGMRKLGDNIIEYRSEDFFEVLRMAFLVL